MHRSRDPRAHELDALAGLEGSVDDAHVRYHAPEFVEHRVEHERPERSVHAGAGGRRDALYDRLEDVWAADSRLRGDEKRIVHRNREDVLYLARDLLHVRARKVHLVEDRHDLELRVLREVCVRDCLRLYALRRVDYEQRAFARAHGSRHLVREVDVSGRVEEVEEVGLTVLRRVVHRDGVGLDRDSPFALEVHRVERLLLELARGNRVRELEDAVGERRLAVVDVRYDAEVANVVQCHCLREIYFLLECGRLNFAKHMGGALICDKRNNVHVSVKHCLNDFTSLPLPLLCPRPC